MTKEGLTIPRLELISAHMATNLVKNVQNALQNLPEPTIYGWLDSTVALHWIRGEGQYRQFVANGSFQKRSIPPHGGNRKYLPSPPSDIREWFVLPPSPDVKAQKYPLPFGHPLFLNFSKGYLAV